ncbi:tRNA-dihydrouridine synthase [Helicosporidium sp. ATCC 50920]|nr:tRNA-dihydrouridine synthase [Helicosporidium sp. ATCC 50920]|eukprot:KDD74535.1 tRNA-dihydrouridine synthase [Helicosporidium sp. ATCC 50920]
MLHARLFLESASYRAEMFSTCAADRPVLAQFCANDPDTLAAAAQLLQDHVDGVDLNLGCPQRIARRGRYGAFLMDDVELVERMVRALAAAVRVPVSVKIRRMSTEPETVAYAARLEAAGASLVAVHGRTREQKTAAVVAADWITMRAVKSALRIPVLVNGNVRCSHDAERLLVFTGADGVLSADSLLVNPALFEGMGEGERGSDGSVAAKDAGADVSSPGATPGSCLSCGRASSPLPSLEPAHDPAWGSHRGLTPHAVPTRGPDLLLEYLDLAAEHPVPYRMVKGHAFKMLNAWLSEHTDIRERLNQRNDLGLEGVRALTLEIRERIVASGRATPRPSLSGKKLAAAEAAAAKEAAIAEQDREQAALDALGGGEYGAEEMAAGA